MLWRGRTHWSMALAGGLSFQAIYRAHAGGRSLPSRCARAAAAVTGIELATGLVVNRALRLGVWDYSRKRLHLWGQICPQYALAWLGLSAAASPLCRALRLYFSRRPGYNSEHVDTQ